jgi:hypothetical protein
MLREKQAATNTGVGVGIILQVFGRILQIQRDDMFVPGLALILLGLVVFAWGCMNYMEGKGHNKWLGLIGLLTILGLVILVLFPDHHREGK